MPVYFSITRSFFVINTKIHEYTIKFTAMIRHAVFSGMLLLAKVKAIPTSSLDL